MSLTRRVLISCVVSVFLTITALLLDTGKLFLPMSLLLLTFGSGLFVYGTTFYAAFMSTGNKWTKNAALKFFKSLVFGVATVTIGFLEMYFQAQALNTSLAINWFGAIWLLVLFSGLWFTKIPKVSAA